MGKAWFWDYRAVFGSDLSPAARLVRLYLASRADGKRPSLAEAAGSCGISITAARRALLELKREGWIKKDEISGHWVLCDPPGLKEAEAGTPPGADRAGLERYPYKFCGHDEEYRRRRKEFLKSLY